MGKERLDKIISNQFCVSRSIARRDIKRRTVTVDGNVVSDFSAIVDTEKSTVTYNGQAMDYKKYVYIVLNKPKGVISASTDKNRETVVDLVPEELRRPGLAPVGRLDRDTTGLLLLTDDGEFAHNVISPKKSIGKVYTVTLDGNLTEDAVKKFRDGIILADGTRCLPAELEIIEPNVARVKIFEGKYHQIKRMFGTVGLGVDELCRNSIGNFTLPGELCPGESREITENEKKLIFE